ncbi:cytochrome c [Bradyrhizobium sp. KB893862 SZCCT0404]|uniref:c-type cytochrome n=1 Tax=Bradyrhizobium sp. KB893862 SZCCT0404 TaxID=2807672 RepID=UPI001BAA7F1A|nr:cytochrome c [Bradyrhizobium sp. KB893862 SZCCT0404]MBR1177029.1 cytochrome c [Bradyrhizobium sp. KB893862 SZCCT0404]
MMQARAFVIAFTIAAAAGGAALADDGAAAFRRCAVCHLPDGKGVPGAFPPLVGRVAKIAATPAGRTYLVSVPSAGLSGKIVVGGVPYGGFMPRQEGVSSSELAAALNYMATELAGDSPPKEFKFFTTDEVEQLQRAAQTLKPADVLKLRGEVAGLGEAPK